MTTSIFKVNATVTSVSNINLFDLKGNLVLSIIILTGIKILYQSLEKHHSGRHSEFYKIRHNSLDTSG